MRQPREARAGTLPSWVDILVVHPLGKDEVGVACCIDLHVELEHDLFGEVVARTLRRILGADYLASEG